MGLMAFTYLKEAMILMTYALCVEVMMDRPTFQEIALVPLLVWITDIGQP